MWHVGDKKKEIQRGDVIEEYKASKVAVMEQLNWLCKGNWTVVHDLWRDMIKKGQKWAKIVRTISVNAAVRLQ